MSRDKEETRLRKALGWPSKFLFGDDIFISYSRADGATYAAGLADRLAGRNFSCRFDLWGTEPGKEMPASLKGALRRSALLVLVGSEGAARSTHVAQEVAEMKRRGRRIVPVAFEGVLLRGGVTCADGALARAGDAAAVGAGPGRDEALWAGDIEGLPVSCERSAVLKSGEPSAEVISRIEKTFTFSRKDERLRRATTFVAALLLLLVGAGVVAGYVAAGKAEEARRMTAEAALAEERARASEGRAKEQEENARQQTVRAEEAAKKATRAEEVARDKTRLADEQTKIAAEQTRIAAEKTQLAAEKTRLADEQTRRAEAASRLAAEQEQNARKNLARSFYAQAQADATAAPLRALAWAGAAVREAPAADEGLPSYALRAVSLASGAPLAVVNTPAGVVSATASPDGGTFVTVTETGWFAVWDGRAGTPLPHPYPDPAADYVLENIHTLKPAFSADSSRIALLVWERPTPEAAREPHLRVWEARTGATVCDIKLEGWAKEGRGPDEREYVDGKEPVGLAFSPGGGEVIVFTWSAGGMFVWDVASGARLVYEQPVKKEKGSDTTALPISRDPAHNWFLEINPDVTVTSPAGREVRTSGLRVRDIRTGRVEAELVLLNSERTVGERVNFAGFARDARRVVITSDNSGQILLRAWDVAAGRASRPAVIYDREQAGSSGGSVEGAHAISPDGRSVVLVRGDGSSYGLGVDVWDIAGDEPKESHYHNTRLASEGRLPVGSSYYADDGEHVINVSVGQDKGSEVTVWSLRTGQLMNRPLLVSGGRIFHVSTRDKTVSAVYADGTILTWSLTRDGTLSRATDRPRLPFFATLVLVGVTPDGQGILTASNSGDNEPKRTLELRDARTWAPRWQTDALTSSWFKGKFSPDGTRFVSMHYQSPDDPPEAGLLLVHRTGDGELEPGFRPIPARWDAVAEFSRDGGALVTRNWNSARGVAIRRWSAKTGEPMPGPAGEFRRTEGEFLGFTRFGEYCMNIPPGLGQENYTEVTLRKMDEGLTPLLKLRFADHGTAALAVALFRDAREIRPAGTEAVVAVLDSGVEVSVAVAPAGAGLTNERTKRRLVPPLDSNADLSTLTVSPDGRLAAAVFKNNEKTLARVWDTATGLPLSDYLWHEGEVKRFAFSPDGRGLQTVTEHGSMRRWFFGDFAGGAPPWAARLGEALGGLRVAGGVDVQRLSPEEQAQRRREFEAELARAAASGDEAARFLLAVLRR